MQRCALVKIVIHIVTQFLNKGRDQVSFWRLMAALGDFDRSCSPLSGMSNQPINSHPLELLN